MASSTHNSLYMYTLKTSIVRPTLEDLPGNTKEVLGRSSNPFSVTMATSSRTSCPSTVEAEQSLRDGVH